jgi:hypothetical protein
MADIITFPSANGVSDSEKGLINSSKPSDNFNGAISTISPPSPSRDILTIDRILKEKIDEFRKAFVKVPQTLIEVDFWFENFIIPFREAGPGFTLNRIVKTPQALIQGNRSDPNGLCGDASAFVLEQYKYCFTNEITFDHFQLAQIVWNDSSEFLNHVANIMIPEKFGFNNKYFFDRANNSIVPIEANFNDDPLNVLSFHVYDLYYKETTQSVAQWWERRANKFGSISILI